MNIDTRLCASHLHESLSELTKSLRALNEPTTEPLRKGPGPAGVISALWIIERTDNVTVDIKEVAQDLIPSLHALRRHADMLAAATGEERADLQNLRITIGKAMGDCACILVDLDASAPAPR